MYVRDSEDDLIRDQYCVCVWPIFISSLRDKATLVQIKSDETNSWETTRTKGHCFLLLVETTQCAFKSSEDIFELYSRCQVNVESATFANDLWSDPLVQY